MDKLTHNPKMCFQSPLWPVCFPEQLELGSQYRQTDPAFLWYMMNSDVEEEERKKRRRRRGGRRRKKNDNNDNNLYCLYKSDCDAPRLLESIRFGLASRETVAQLNRVKRKLTPPGGLRPTRLYAHNRSVDAENETELKKLPLPEHTYLANDWAETPQLLQQLNSNCIAARSLVLRVGAQVLPPKSKKKTINTCLLIGDAREESDAVPGQWLAGCHCAL